MARPPIAAQLAGSEDEATHTRGVAYSSQFAELEASLDQGDETASSSRSLAFQSGRQSIRFPRLEAARLLMAWPMAAANDQDSVMGADLATTLLAEGRRSRLVQRLREDLQIVESIDMDVTVMTSDRREFIKIIGSGCQNRLAKDVEVFSDEINEPCLLLLIHGANEFHIGRRNQSGVPSLEPSSTTTTS